MLPSTAIGGAAASTAGAGTIKVRTTMNASSSPSTAPMPMRIRFMPPPPCLPESSSFHCRGRLYKEVAHLGDRVRETAAQDRDSFRQCRKQPRRAGRVQNDEDALVGFTADQPAKRL